MTEIHTHKLVLHIGGFISDISGITATAGRANDFALTHKACKLLLYCWGNAEDNINIKKDSWLLPNGMRFVPVTEHAARHFLLAESMQFWYRSVFACMELIGILIKCNGMYMFVYTRIISIYLIVEKHVIAIRFFSDGCEGLLRVRTQPKSSHFGW